MIQLNADPSFSFELLRAMGATRYGAADVAELLQAGDAIKPGDAESFYQVFYDLASRIDEQGKAIDAIKYPVSARDTFFRAATYYRAADFYIHGNKKDPRIWELYEKQQVAFDSAIALMPRPGQRVQVPSADGSFKIETTLYLAPGASAANPRPTIIVSSGFDGAQEEMLHVCGIAGLERDYNILTYDGPGQPTVIRNQGVGFIHDWEKVVTPVVDYLATLKEVDQNRVSLFGYSMAGQLCLRAAAFEHRLAAVISVDGVYDVSKAFSSMLSPDALDSYVAGDLAKAGKITEALLELGKVDTKTRWAIEHGTFSFNTDTVEEMLQKVKLMTLEGLADKIQCPVWIGCAEDDIFFKGQPEMVKEAIGDKGTLQRMTALDAASAHCHVGAASFFNATVFDWLDKAMQ